MKRARLTRPFPRLLTVACLRKKYDCFAVYQLSLSGVTFKAANYEIQKPSTCHATLFRCSFAFFTLRDQLDARNKNICCGLKKVVTRSKARVYFEYQIWALLLVFHQTHNLSCNKFTHVARHVKVFVSRISPLLLWSRGVGENSLEGVGTLREQGVFQGKMVLG